jgi:hypothetical protein
MGDYYRFTDPKVIQVPIKAALAGYDKHPNGISIETIGQIWANGPFGPFEDDTLLLVMNANRLRHMVTSPMNIYEPKMEVRRAYLGVVDATIWSRRSNATIIAQFEFPRNYVEAHEAGEHYPYLFTTKGWQSKADMKPINPEHKVQPTDGILVKGNFPESRLRLDSKAPGNLTEADIPGSNQPSYIRLYIDGTMIEKACEGLPPPGTSSHSVEIMFPVRAARLLDLETDTGKIERIELKDAFEVQISAYPVVINYCFGAFPYPLPL